ncbi:MT-A70-domain-containing protein [Gautieria morchelliformis]|nr:MT-A70-domain-containing protein [Gautieria morchelliformis]
MSEEEQLETELRQLLVNPSVKLPLSCSRILGYLIASGSSIRLSDQPRLESLLYKLANKSEAPISIIKDMNGVSVTSVHAPNDADHSPRLKRKRSNSDEIDSAHRDVSYCGTIRNVVPLHTTDKVIQDVFALLQEGTTRAKLLVEQHGSANDRFEPICEHITKETCAKVRLDSGLPHSTALCDKIHFRPLIRPHTDPTLGHCSYLNTCYSEPTYALSPSIPPFPSSNIPRPPSSISLPSGLGAGGRGKEKAPCRYLHFEVDYDGSIPEAERERRREKDRLGSQEYHSTHKLGIGLGPEGVEVDLLPPQWINCDLRRFDYSVLGKFHVIMADPPWDIHMSLPYGTMTDDEMRAMPIPALQDEGLLFLWVTGRAMEVGRECMRVWGYTRVDEVIWLKTNQLQRVIRTGRTGHWLNHTKEHMLVGVKTVSDENGNLKFPAWANRGLDTDVIVSEVRETSRKPEEVYGVIERMCPGGRKVEIFGRKHNTRPGWLTLGNQLGNADQIYEEGLAARVAARYPERTNLAM